MAALSASISVNVDIDAIRFYRSIHGLPRLATVAPDPVWTYGVPRLLDLFAELGVRATFFVVAADLVPVSDGGAVQAIAEVKRYRELVRTMIAQGHEVASHSFGHDYVLSRRPLQAINADLLRARAVLSDVTGVSVRGFRAPGYNLSRHLIEAIQESGATYSSSRLPSPPYVAAKWLMMLKGALTRRSSESIVGEMTAPFFSRLPYRHRRGLLELPISVMPWLRLPVIGTFLTLYGKRGKRWLLPRLSHETWLNLEFHGIDLVDAADVAVGQELANYQLDLQTPVAKKRALFNTWISHLAQHRLNLTLEEVAATIETHAHDLSRF